MSAKFPRGGSNRPSGSQPIFIYLFIYLFFYPILQAIFKQSLYTGQIPSDWKKAIVTPLFKKCSVFDIERQEFVNKLQNSRGTKFYVLHARRNKIDRKSNFVCEAS